MMEHKITVVIKNKQTEKKTNKLDLVTTNLKGIHKSL